MTSTKKKINKFLIKTIIFYIDLLMLIYDLKGNLKNFKEKSQKQPHLASNKNKHKTIYGNKKSDNKGLNLANNSSK